MQGADLCRKYGVYGIASLALRNDFIEAIEIIRTLTGEVCMPDGSCSSLSALWLQVDDVDMTDLSAGMWYFLAHKRGERGNDPEAEAREHSDSPRVTQQHLSTLLQ